MIRLIPNEDGYTACDSNEVIGEIICKNNVITKLTCNDISIADGLVRAVLSRLLDNNVISVEINDNDIVDKLKKIGYPIENNKIYDINKVFNHCCKKNI